MARKKSTSSKPRKRREKPAVIHWGIFEDFEQNKSVGPIMDHLMAMDPQIGIDLPSAGRFEIRATGPAARMAQERQRRPYIAKVEAFDPEFRYRREFIGVDRPPMAKEALFGFGSVRRPILLNIRARDNGFYILWSVGLSFFFQRITEEFFRALLRSQLAEREPEPFNAVSRMIRPPLATRVWYENLLDESPRTGAPVGPGWDLPQWFRQLGASAMTYYNNLWPEAQRVIREARTMEEASSVLTDAVRVQLLAAEARARRLEEEARRETAAPIFSGALGMYENVVLHENWAPIGRPAPARQRPYKKPPAPVAPRAPEPTVRRIKLGKSST